jgi:hypothetical protein
MTGQAWREGKGELIADLEWGKYSLEPCSPTPHTEPKQTVKVPGRARPEDGNDVMQPIPLDVLKKGCRGGPDGT